MLWIISKLRHHLINDILPAQLHFSSIPSQHIHKPSMLQDISSKQFSNILQHLPGQTQ